MRKTVTLLSLLGVLGVLGPAAAGWDEGVAAYQAKKYDQAIKEFLSVVEQQPEEFSGHQMLGRSYLAKKDYKKAVPSLRKALEMKSGDIGTRLSIGQALYQLGSYREVTEVLGSMNPASLPKGAQAAFHQMRGVSHQKLGREDRALGDLKKASQLNSGSAAAQFNYGAALMSMGDTRGAIVALEKAVRLDGKDQTKRKAYVKALIRSARESRGAAKDAAYLKAEGPAQTLANAQRSFENLLTLGEVQLGAKKYDAAIVNLQEASGKNPGSWLPLFYVGQAYTAKADYVPAEEPLQKALQHARDPRDQKRVWGQLGFVFEKQRRFSEAKDAYQKSGNDIAFQRVAENEAIAKENADIEKHNQMVEDLEKEAKELEEELKTLPGGSTPPR